MTLTYAIGDIHGCGDLLDQLLSGIERHREGRLRKLVFLGDYVDRGPDTAGVIARVRALQTAEPESVVCLKGNHEEFMVRAIDDPGILEHWLANGGDATLRSFGVRDPGELPADVLSWADGLPTMFEDELRYFVHAGFDPDLAAEHSNDHTRLWIRGRFLRIDRDFGKHVVHGHTALNTGVPDERMFRTNLDTAAVYGGFLTAGVFNDEQATAIVFLRVC